LERIPVGSGDPQAALLAYRPVWFPDGEAELQPLSTAVYERDRLRAGDRLASPALVVQLDATTVVPPSWQAEVDEWGNLVIARSKRP
jgi:N-methylhydantoinase A